MKLDQEGFFNGPQNATERRNTDLIANFIMIKVDSFLDSRQ